MTSIVKHKKKILMKKKGSSLAIAILLLLVLSITVVAIMMVSQTENNTEIFQNRRTQAYYLAWSGANSVGDWIIKNPASAIALVGKSSTNSSSFSNGEVTVEVKADVAMKLLIKGTGIVKGVSNTANLRLEKLNSSQMLDRAIYSNAPLDITGMNISGDVQSGGNINYSSNGSNTFSGVPYPYEERFFELAAFPSPPVYGTGIINLKKTDQAISVSGSFTSIDVENQANLNLNPNGVMKIVVDNMNIDGNLNIDGVNGRVELYINNSLTVTTKGFINNEDGNPNDLVIFLKKDSMFYMQANKILSAYVIGPEATMQIQSAQSTTNGALITNIIRKNAQGQGPNGAINYIPPDASLDIHSILISYRIFQWE